MTGRSSTPIIYGLYPFDKSNLPLSEIDITRSLIPAAGLGAFTRKKISRGDVVGIYCGIAYNKAVLNIRYHEQDVATYVLRVNCTDAKFCGCVSIINRHKSHEIYIDATRSGHWTRYINQSATGNNNLTFGDNGIIWAVKDIHPREELTVSYGAVYWERIQDTEKIVEVDAEDPHVFGTYPKVNPPTKLKIEIHLNSVYASVHIPRNTVIGLFGGIAINRSEFVRRHGTSHQSSLIVRTICNRSDLCGRYTGKSRHTPHEIFIDASRNEHWSKHIKYTQDPNLFNLRFSECGAIISNSDILVGSELFLCGINPFTVLQT